MVNGKLQAYAWLFRSQVYFHFSPCFLQVQGLYMCGVFDAFYL